MRTSVPYKLFWLNALLPMFLLSACQEKIDLELKPGEKILAIDAILTDIDDPACTVRLWRTTDYFSPADAPPVTQAQVWVTDETLGQTDTLRQSPNEPGKYLSTNLVGTVGHTYTLYVREGGKLYTANATMPRTLELDTVLFEWEAGNIFQEEGWWVVFVGQENPGLGDNILLQHYINGQLQTKPDQRLVSDDRGVDGNFLAFSIFGPFQNAGDTITLESSTIDRKSLDYYLAIANLQSNGGNGPFDSPRWNAPTNIQGGAVGLFRVSSTRRRSAIVPAR